MIPYVRIEMTFEPHTDDVGELYESTRACAEQLRAFGIRAMNFHVTVRADDDDELPAF